MGTESSVTWEMQGKTPKGTTEKEVPDAGYFNLPFRMRPANVSLLSTAKPAGRKKLAERTNPKPPCPGFWLGDMMFLYYWS